MDPRLELFDRVAKYLGQRISLSDLEEWTAAHLEVLLQRPGDAAYQVAGAIELGLADLSAGVATENEFREVLSSYFRAPIRLDLAGTRTVLSSSTTCSLTVEHRMGTTAAPQTLWFARR